MAVSSPSCSPEPAACSCRPTPYHPAPCLAAGTRAPTSGCCAREAPTPTACPGSPPAAPPPLGSHPYAKNSTTHLVQVRTLDVAAAGHDLIADSRLDLQTRLSATAPVPTEPCFSSLTTPDGGTVICGTAGITVQAHPGCTGTPPSFDSYSAATGEPLHVLYLSYGPCSGGVAVPLWTDSSASQVIGLIAGTADFPRTEAPAVYLIVDGNLTPLPGSAVSSVLLAGNELGGIAF